MARATFVLRDGQLLEKHLAPPPPNAGRRLGHAPYIRTDGMSPLRSMADGQMYDSKSSYYRSVREAGCEIVGDDVGGFSGTPGYREQNLEQDIKDAVAQLEAGTAEPVAPGPLQLGGWD